MDIVRDGKFVLEMELLVDSLLDGMTSEFFI